MRTLALLSVAVLAAACGGGRPRGPSPAGPTTQQSAVNATARADVRDANGQSLGTVTLTQTPHGVLLQGDLSNLPPGTKALHFHEVGRCDPPFTGAGGHYNPTMRVHGFKSAGGYHAGDLPNFGVGPNGTGRVDLLSRDVTLGTGPGSLFDIDGTSLVVHAGARAPGRVRRVVVRARVACGIVSR
jgi:superoxide dismutase, Cu-Zn family